MKKFYLRMWQSAEAIIEAESEEEAFEIAHNANPFDLQESSYELEELEELSEHESDDGFYVLPVLIQTKEGYEVKK